MRKRKPGKKGLLRASKLLRWGEPLVGVCFLLLFSSLFYEQLPEIFFNSPLPATGGDTGSHFWPVHVLFHHGFSQGVVKVWNPGNLTGEPLLVHYFPLPFILMALMGFVLPLGMAFNIGTLLPLFLLPFCTYFGLRLMGLKFPAPIFAAASTLPFLYNESNSMWGGNTLSTMAGQFAHGYALCFVVLGVGFLYHETRKNRFPLLSGLMFAAVALSHAYVLLGVPIFVLVYLLAFPKHMDPQSHLNFGLSCLGRFKKALISGIIALVFSIWFLAPMIDNSKWNTAFAFPWWSEDIWAEIIHNIFYPTLALLGFSITLYLASIITAKFKSRETLIFSITTLPFLACLAWYEPRVLVSYPFLVFIFFNRSNSFSQKISKSSWLLLIWLIPALFYAGMFKVFPKIGLVDVRVVPQTQLFLSILAGAWLGLQLRSVGRLSAWVFSGVLLIGSYLWSAEQIKNFPHWAKFNYGGWQNKSGYPDLQKLYGHVKGDFSDPRIIFEHNDVNNQAGTTRVFEMLPYFAGRSTLESVYMQASIVSPVVFYAQALVSKTPSCPFPNFKCTGHIKTQEEVRNLSDKLDLLGVKGLILHTPEVRNPIQESGLFSEEKSFGPWHYREIQRDISLVEVIQEKPEVLSFESDWKRDFYRWFRDYKTGNKLLLSSEQTNSESLDSFKNDNEAWSGAVNCNPKVEVGFSRIHLSTNCPNKAHLLKFSYHPSWSGETSGPIYNVSPGFMALVPGAKTLELEFGRSLLWQLSRIVSVFGSMAVLAYCLSRGLRKIKKGQGGKSHA